MSWNFSRNHSILSYFNLEKRINLEQTDFSYQTYSLFNTKKPFFSLALAYEGRWVDERYQLRLDLYQYHYQFNDYWEEYVRNGFFIKGQIQPFPRWIMLARVGYYRDNFLFDQIRSTTCEFDEVTTGAANQVVTCKRNDQGLAFQGSISFIQKPQFAWSFHFNYNKHESFPLRLYDEERMEWLFSFSMGFPNIKKTTHLTNRFTETAPRYEGY
jgi:hypothetical protein